MDFNALAGFLAELRQNNHKEWFDAHKPTYQHLRADFIDFVNALIEGAASIDPQLAGLQAKDCLFRINRDVRFSANKNPYKTNFSAYLSKGGKKYPGAGYYFHFEPQASFLAAGIWMPEPNLLKAIRQEIDYGWENFATLLRQAEKNGLSMEGEKLARPPKGYEAENPAIEILKYKSFVLTAPFVMESNSLELRKSFETRIAELKSFVYFLNQASDAESL